MGHSHGVQTLAIWVVAAGCQFDTSPLLRSDACLALEGAQNAALCSAAAKPQQTVSAVTEFGNPPPAPTPTSSPRLAAMAAIDAAPPPRSAPAPGDGQPVAPPAEALDLDAGASNPRDATPGAPDAAEAGADARAQTAPPGTAFSACSSSAQCTGGLVCTVESTVPSLPGASLGYCTATCGTSWMSTVCPQPRSGTIVASCQVNALCMLGSCAQARCPSAMTCVQTPLPSISGQVLSECQPR